MEEGLEKIAAVKSTNKEDDKEEDDYFPAKKLLSLIRSKDLIDSSKLNFYASFVPRVEASGETIDRLLERFKPILDDLLKEIKGYKAALPWTAEQNFNFLTILNFFAENGILAHILCAYEWSPIVEHGSFEDSLIGSLMTLGPDLKFFQNLSDDQKSHNLKLNSVHVSMDRLHTQMYRFFHRLLRADDKILYWIGWILRSFTNRDDAWYNLCGTSKINLIANLQNILLRLNDQTEVFEIQHSYYRATKAALEPGAASRNIHVAGLPETYFKSLISGEGPSSMPPFPLEESYRQSSEIFFMLHIVFGVSFTRIYDEFLRLDEEMEQLRVNDEKLVEVKGPGKTEAGFTWNDHNVPQYYSAILNNPHMLRKSFKFVALTATYLVHAAMTAPGDPAPSYVNFAKFPPPDASGGFLAFIPELLINNIHAFFTFLRDDYKDDLFKEKCYYHYGEQGKWTYLDSMFEYLLLFMSNPQFIHNPCLRATLAEDLECIVIKWNWLNNDNRAKFLVEHPSARRLMACLMAFLVGMKQASPEMDIENQLRFIGPVRSIFSYLSHFPLHTQALQGLVGAADNLFLKFTNHLTRNALFFLNEALSMMKEIRNVTSDSSSEVRKEFESVMSKTWSLSIATLEILAELTSVVGSSLSHLVEIALIAVMVNHCLQNLVGPTKVKVRDLKEFSFGIDIELELMLDHVLNICKFMSKNNVFLRILSRCNQSYELLHEAGTTLQLPAITAIALKINEVSRMEREEEAGLEIIPEEMTDNFTGGLARDPVTVSQYGTVGVGVAIEKWLRKEFEEDSTTIEMIVPDQDLSLSIEDLLAQRRNQ